MFFYTTMDDAWRPDKVWRHVIGTPVDRGRGRLDETDERFNVGVGLTRSEQFILFVASSKITSEFAYVPADAPLSDPG